MNIKINVAERLKGCPEGTKLYSTLCGECILSEILEDDICTIFHMHWNGEEVEYKIKDEDEIQNGHIWLANEISPYKEETMDKNICNTCPNDEGCMVYCDKKKEEIIEETKKDIDWHPTDYLEFENNDEWADKVEVNLGKNYEIQVKDGKTFIVKKKPQYPKTYKECFAFLYPNKHHICYVAGLDGLDNNKELFEAFIRLKLCRDAYWKMTKDWKPDWKNDNEEKYTIYVYADNIFLRRYRNTQVFLAFPTEEMRDAFYKNFKDLIEQCKEFL